MRPVSPRPRKFPPRRQARRASVLPPGAACCQKGHRPAGLCAAVRARTPGMLARTRCASRGAPISWSKGGEHTLVHSPSRPPQLTGALGHSAGAYCSSSARAKSSIAESISPASNVACACAVSSAADICYQPALPATVARQVAGHGARQTPF
eukprot:scaffold2910_cov112-Isochrysis_galbana.AAC.1